MQQGTVKSYNKMKNDFYKKFRSVIVPIAKRQEKKRETYLFITIASYILFWSFDIWLMCNCIIEPQLNGVEIDKSLRELYIYIFFGSLIAPIWLQDLLTKSIEKTIKSKIMPDVCKCIGDLSWTEGCYENENILAQAKLIPDNYNGVSIDDVFMGEYNDVNIDIIESEYTKTTGSGKNRRTVTYFKGVFVVLDMNKNFKGHTVILPDGIFKIEPDGLRHTTLEDIKFEKKFDVYTDDEIEARYLITTSFMDRLNEMKTAFNAKNLSCAFYDGLLIIAFGIEKDCFSIVSLFKKTDDHKKYFQMFEEFLSIIKLIDYFKLNERTGLWCRKI